MKILGYTTSFRVAGKGEIHFAVADAPDCLASEIALAATQSFTVTGGTGIYAGVSGSGRIERAATFLGGGSAGTDTWIGTLVVPGLEFDVTPPTLSGATSKTVRAPKNAKRVRVTYNVTASDALDGRSQSDAHRRRAVDSQGPHRGQLLSHRHERKYEHREVPDHGQAKTMTRLTYSAGSADQEGGRGGRPNPEAG